MCSILQRLPEGEIYPAVVYSTGRKEKPYEIDLRVSRPWELFPEMRARRELLSAILAAQGRANEHKIELIVQGDKHELSRIMRAFNNKPGNLRDEEKNIAA